jgi:transposase
VIELRAGTKICLAAGVTDMRRGFDGLSAKVQTVLEQQPFSGHVFVFRGRRGDIVKLLWWDGDDLCLFAKRLERGRFIWPQATEGTVCLTRTQLSILLEGIDWRRADFQRLSTALSSKMEAIAPAACDTRFRRILIAEHLTRLLMLLGFVPMHSDSQRCAFTAITPVQIPSGTPIRINNLYRFSPDIRGCKKPHFGVLFAPPR